MIERRQFYIDGAWVDPVAPRDHHVINPATEEAIATISLGGEADAIKAILAARAAFDGYSNSSVDERVAILRLQFTQISDDTQLPCRTRQ